MHEATQQQAQSYEEVRSYFGLKAVQPTCCCCTVCRGDTSNSSSMPLDILWYGLSWPGGGLQPH